MIYHSCCMLIFFFFFAQLVVTLPTFFSKLLPIQYILFPIYQAYFWLLLKKKKLFMCVVYAFKDFHEKKNNALDFKKCWKQKQNQAKSKVRFGILRANFLGCALYHALAALCAWKIESCRDVLWKLNILYENFFCFLAEECMKKQKQKYSVKEITYFLHIVMHAKVK